MTSTAWCSEPRRHAAFGYHQRGPEGPYCTSCHVVAAPIETSGSGDGEGTEANKPSSTPQVDPATTSPAADVPSAGFSSTPIVDPDTVPQTTGQPLPSAPSAPAPDFAQPLILPYSKRKDPKPCFHCGAMFVPARRTHVYCKRSCKSAAWNMRKRIRDAANEGRYYKPMRRRPALAGLIGSRPYQIPPTRESDD